MVEPTNMSTQHLLNKRPVCFISINMRTYNLYNTVRIFVLFLNKFIIYTAMLYVISNTL